VQREVLLALAALRCGVEMVACKHLPSRASPLAMHRAALDAVYAEGDSARDFSATAQRIGADELFGWAYDRLERRLLRVADDVDAVAAQAGRWVSGGVAGYGPFRWVSGDTGPDGLVWIDDRRWSEWGFACLVLPARVSDADALRIEALIALVDKVVLSAPSDPAEAFRWELHPYGDDAVVPGYDVWTVRAAPDRIVVVRSVAGPSC